MAFDFGSAATALRGGVPNLYVLEQTVAGARRANELTKRCEAMATALENEGPAARPFGFPGAHWLREAASSSWAQRMPISHTNAEVVVRMHNWLANMDCWAPDTELLRRELSRVRREHDNAVAEAERKKEGA